MAEYQLWTDRQTVYVVLLLAPSSSSGTSCPPPAPG